MYPNKLPEQRVQYVVNGIDWAFSQSFNENSTNIQDYYSQIENGETTGPKYSNENDSEDTETNKTSVIPNFMPQILPDHEITKA